MTIRLRKIQPFDDLTHIKQFATREIINPHNQDKHILRYDANKGTLLRNDCFQKNSENKYRLANSRYFGYKSMLKITHDIESGDITERYSVCRDKSTHPYCTVKTRYIIYP
ncbi:MAG: hypothetical protein LKG27_06050, partial [Clostridiaceae bacterium]|nr:hypothetical protein [Clostridiaceae bacterium]